MADNSTWSREQTSRVRDFYNINTRGFSAEAFQRLFTRDTRDAYRYFSNAVDREALAALPWWKRPALIQRRNGEIERLSEGGIALGMFDSSRYTAERGRLEPGDLLVLYSDGITEAESPSGTPFDEEGLTALMRAHVVNPDLTAIGAAVIKAVERHAQDVRFADDLTVLLARRTVPRNPPAPPSVLEP